ncbi:Glutamine-dependent NAD(+) synthetase [Sparganum proliferum]
MDVDESPLNFTFSVCCLNQWALDFAGNTRRIRQSILKAKQEGSRYRLGPELELSGYGCEDHFHEADTYAHSWECLAEILKSTVQEVAYRDIVCDIGMPVRFENARFNCRLVILNGRILLIRPKTVLADGGLHREPRWFTAWNHAEKLRQYPLPEIITSATPLRQTSAPFGCPLLRFSTPSSDSLLLIGLVTCEELWVTAPPHVAYARAGADVVMNASASHHELRKLDSRVRLVQSASAKKLAYAYANLVGCDAGRACYDGGAIVAVCGSVVCLSSCFGLDEVQTTTVIINIQEVRSSRKSDAVQVSEEVEILDVNFNLFNSLAEVVQLPSPITHLPSPEEEIALGPALWLWDILRRSGSGGFFLCLSGGLDSSSVACIVFSMCQQVYRAISAGNETVLSDCRKILNDALFRPQSPHELCSRVLTTCYMSSSNSSTETRNRAADLAEALGCRHLEVSINHAVEAFLSATLQGLNESGWPLFESEGGTPTEDLALQNLQARSRLVLSYLTAQLLPWSKRHKAFNSSSSNIARPPLVLSSANLDECLSGYLTKYDCSSADVNPIGSISKQDLRRFIKFASTHLLIDSENQEDLTGAASRRNMLQKTLLEILAAPPSAELRPLNGAATYQTDEQEMGLSYSQLSQLGRLRLSGGRACGPREMLANLLQQVDSSAAYDFGDGDSDISIARKLCERVKLFFRKYSANRHKATVLPPAYHTESYSADDNRFDLRPFLYPVDWTHQFASMDRLVEEWEAAHPPC